MLRLELNVYGLSHPCILCFKNDNKSFKWVRSHWKQHEVGQKKKKIKYYAILGILFDKESA